MNIFATYNCPKKSAKYLDNVRLIKMTLESAQILSTVIHLSGRIGPYKKTHSSHPCVIWAAKNSGNYKWLLEHFKALLELYTKKYGKKHKCGELLPIFESELLLRPSGELESFVNCTKFKEIPDTNLAYRICLRDKWKNDKRTPKWK